MKQRGGKEGPDPVDIHVGGRVRRRRTLLSLSQQELGERLGLSFQQVQKYERGANRIPASRLYALAGILDVPVRFFFVGLPAVAGTVPETRRDPLPGCACAVCRDGTEPRSAFGPEALKLIAAYSRIRPPGLRKKLAALIRALGKGDDAKREAASHRQ